MENRDEQLRPVVAVPARNEEQRLPLLLAALAAQTWCQTAAAPLPVVLVLNNCTDRTRKVALQAAHDHPCLAAEIVEIDFESDLAHAGSARRLAMDRAAARCPDGVILTTDADAIPERNWIDANLAALARGADLVGGKLYGNRLEEAQLGPGFLARAQAVLAYAALCDRLASLIDPSLHDPWPRHSDHTGGSLAIRARFYSALGGLPVLPRREDLALVAKAREAGGRLVHPLDVRVEVSARLVGRATGGMADCLKDWMRAEAEGLPLLVEDPVRVEDRLRRRRAARQLGTLPATERQATATALGWNIRLPGEEEASITPDALAQRLCPDEPDAPATVAVATATLRLEEIIAELEGTARAA